MSEVSFGVDLDARALLSAIKLVRKAVKRSLEKRFRYIVVRQDASGFFLETNDLETAARVKLSTTSSHGTGAAGVRPECLQSLVQIAAASSKTISLEVEDDRMKMRFGRRALETNVSSTEDLPTMPRMPEQSTFVIERRELLRVFRATLRVAGRDWMRPHLEGVLLHSSSEGLRAVATDGHRLVRIAVALSERLSEQRILIPRSAVEAMIQSLLLSKGDDKVRFFADDKIAAVQGTNFGVVASHRCGRFPPYEQVIEQGAVGEVAISRVAAMDAARIAIATGGRESCVRISSSGEAIRLGVESGDVSFFEELPHSGSKINAKVRAVHLLDGASLCRGDELRIQYTDDSGVILIGDDQALTVATTVR